jgi:bifunctional N-acetylglucosamine-1-phosphate-uridyltransferase/glucosamine-1-phosphate-acetyltransferase GlmU-like protein
LKQSIATGYGRIVSGGKGFQIVEEKDADEAQEKNQGSQFSILHS